MPNTGLYFNIKYYQYFNYKMYIYLSLYNKHWHADFLQGGIF